MADESNEKRERFIAIGTPSGETTVDLHRVVMVRLDVDAVVLTHDDSIARQLVELLADRDYHAQRADAAEANYRFMVERATNGGRLDGYRELGQRAADAERQRDEARAEVYRLLGGLAEIFDWAPESVTVDTALRSVREHKKHGSTGWHRAELAGDEYRRAMAEVARLRSRVRVDAEDVERAGVTPAKVASWLRGNRQRAQRCTDVAYPR